MGRPIVLDSSALLAMLFSERGGDIVLRERDRACMCTVNLCEALAVYSRRGQDAGRMLVETLDSELSMIDFTIELAALAADLEVATRVHGLSLGDRACLALAMDRDLPVLTADRIWAQLSLPVQIELIR